MEYLLLMIQALVMILAAPLLAGYIRKLKNDLRMRKGAGVLQNYRNLSKLLKKDRMRSTQCSWIFNAAPYLVFSVMAFACALVPAVPGMLRSVGIGDFLLLAFLFAFARFFTALAGLDAGSAFGGMGSSREMFISSFAEPALILAVFAAGLSAGTMDFATAGALGMPSLSVILSGSAVFLVALAESGRIPIDNHETHLELTMIHEAMVLEYSGSHLALIEWSSGVKQILLLSFLAWIIPPYAGVAGGGTGEFAVAVAVYVTKLLALGALVALTEVSMAKMRLLRASDFLGFAFSLAAFALVAFSLGW